MSPSKVSAEQVQRTDKPWMKYYTDEEINTPLPVCSIHDYLWENNREHREDIALEYFGRKISYGKLSENIELAARAFSALGIIAGDIVIMATVTTPEVIYAFYALNRIGAIPNMVDPRTSIEGIRDYVEEAGASYVVTLDACYEKVSEACKETAVKRIVVVSPGDSLPAAKKLAYFVSNKLKGKAGRYAPCAILWKNFIENGKGAESKAAPYAENKCCVIVHTGGTTGTPKGVMLSNENLNASVIQCQKSGFNFQRGHRWLGVMPPFIAYGIGNGLHLPLSMGMTLIVLPSFDPNKYDELLLKHRPNHIAGVPSHYNKLIHSKKLENANLKFLISPIVGGDGVETHFEEEVNRFLLAHGCESKLIKGYGMTEVCAAICASAKNEYNKVGSVGIPFTHSVMGVFSGEKELPFNETGEICMRGPHLMMGYYKNEVETKAVMKIHSDGHIWLHSGDIGYMDEDGSVFIMGRQKRMIVRHDGFKVYPTLIEKVVAAHPAVEACCAVGQADEGFNQGQLPVVFVVAKAECTMGDKEIIQKLRQHCQKELPEYALPAAYYFKDTLPVTSIGKVDYRALEAQANKLNAV